MRYLVLACDYDGTLAFGGSVAEGTVVALERLRQSGRKLVLVTGRELEDLLQIFPQIQFFEWVVAENGALVYQPATRRKFHQGSPPPAKFMSALKERGVVPLSVGHVIVSTRQPNETAVLDVIRDLGLEMQIIFNKGAVMVLPAGINKATGLTAALREMGISPHNTAGVGDAENDHAFLSLCECSVAVANALPMVKEHADFVAAQSYGEGVGELIDEIATEDLRRRDGLLKRHHIFMGIHESGKEEWLSPYGVNILIAGPSGSGKSTLATALMERFREHGYQFCVVDPEGDYETLEAAVTLGDSHGTPSAEEVLQLLKNPEENAVVNLVGLRLTDRPAFFSALLPHLEEMRARVGRPHWLVVDEAHHLLPTSWEPSPQTLPKGFHGMLLITVHPKSVARTVLSSIDVVIAVGESAENTFKEIAGALGQVPDMPHVNLKHGEVLMWWRKKEKLPFKLRTVSSRNERRRHRRKYAEGDLGPERSFYFQGPLGKLKLRAQNLTLFMQIAEGIDEETWNYHLRRGDYSRWFRERIKDETLAAEAKRIEDMDGLSQDESCSLINAAIRERYTLPS